MGTDGASGGKGPVAWPRALTLVAVVAVALVVGIGWLAYRSYRIESLRNLAGTAAAASRWDEAARALDRLLAARPADLAALRLRAEVALAQGDRSAAAATLARVPDSAPEAGSAQLRRGLLLKELFRVREAEAAFRAAAARLPGEPAPLRELVGLLGIERRANEQESVLWALHRAGRAVEALRLLGQSSVVIPPGTLDRTVDEGSVLEKCLEADPTDPHLRPPLARFYRQRGDTEAAARLLEPWLEAHPDDAPARAEWLALRIDEGDTAGTAEWFERPPPELAAQADYHRLRGDWLSLRNQPAEAVRAYREAVKLAPRDPLARWRLHLGLRAAGLGVEAEGALKTYQGLQTLATAVAAVDPDAPKADRVLAAARACRALGDDRRRETRAWYSLVVRFDPANAEARAVLAEPLPSAPAARPVKVTP